MNGLGILGLQPLALDAEDSSAGSSDPVIVDVTATDTTAVVTYTGTATHYRLDGGSSVAIGASPHTITGLTANTEYTVEITADEVTWTDAYAFGTDNSGSGGGDIEAPVDLTVQDAAHGHTADSPTLTTEWLLTVADAAHGHAAENVTLGTSDAISLTVQDATHAHAADSVITSTDWLLSVADALHAHSTDGVTLDTAPVLVVADALHGHAAESPTLVTDSWLQPDDALHAHAADSIVLGGVDPPEPDPAPPFTGVAGGGGMSNVPRRHQATIDAEEWEDAQRLRIQKDDEMVLDCITALVAAGVI